MTTKILDGFDKMHIDTGFGKAEAVVCSIKDDKLFNKTIESLKANNTFMPSVSRIIFNAKQEKTADGPKNTLATIVYFDDNTKVTVINSDNDKVEMVTDKETGVITADEASKERALTYAICKKLFGNPDEKGHVHGNGFGRKLRDLVASGWDQGVEEKKIVLQKAKAKARHEELMKKAAAKPKRLSLAQAMDRLSVAIKEVETLKAEVNSLKGNAVA